MACCILETDLLPPDAQHLVRANTIFLKVTLKHDLNHFYQGVLFPNYPDSAPAVLQTYTTYPKSYTSCLRARVCTDDISNY